MGIHISLGILVWGYTKHGDTHITVTPALVPEKLTIQRLSAQVKKDLPKSMPE
jgi:hypothetical protein